MSSRKGDLYRNTTRQLASMAEKLTKTAADFGDVDMFYVSELEQLVDRIEDLRNDLNSGRRQRRN